MKSRVLVADDHEIVRRGVVALFEDQPDLEVTGQAASAPEVLKEVRESTYDLLILDLSMPGGEGLETLTRIKAAAPELTIIILSVHPEDQLAERLLRAGASGYVNKESATEQLIAASRRTLDGQRYVSPDLASRLASRLAGDMDQEPHEGLSDREFQVLRLLGEGQSVSDIADRLSLSVKTVSTYKSRLLDKMEMENTAELIRYAVDHDLVE